MACGCPSVCLYVRPSVCPSVCPYELVSVITFDVNDLASPNFVCHLIYKGSRPSLYMGDIDLLLKVTGQHMSIRHTLVSGRYLEK